MILDESSERTPSGSSPLGMSGRDWRAEFDTAYAPPESAVRQASSLLLDTALTFQASVSQGLRQRRQLSKHASRVTPLAGEQTGEREQKSLEIGMFVPVSKTVSGR
jgi:hypothetical protein